MSIIYGAVCGNKAPIKTLTVVDENNNEFVGVVVDSEVIFDAKPKDVKIGKIFASDDGILEGTDTRTYRVTAGFCGVLAGKSFTIPLKTYDRYDYTKLQCIITPFNTTQLDSVAAEKVVINDVVYQVNSTEKISDVTKNSETKSIDLNIVNNTKSNYYIRYFTYREEE